MILQPLFFYLFSVVVVAAGFMVIAAKNPVHSVLFLFVVMMLDVDFAELKQGTLQYLPIGALVGIILLAELVLVLFGALVSPEVSATVAAPTPSPDQVSNVAALGALLYTRYVFFFQMAGMVLLVAMIGAIVLTLRHKENVKRQNIAAQVARNPATAVTIVRVETGRGLSS